MKPQYALGSIGLTILMSSNGYIIRKWFAQDKYLIVEITLSKTSWARSFVDGVSQWRSQAEKEWYIALRTVHMCRSQRMRWLGSVTTSWRQRTRKNTGSYWNMIRHSMCPWCMMSFPADEFLLQSLLEVIIPISMFTLLAVVSKYDKIWLIHKFSLSLSLSWVDWPCCFNTSSTSLKCFCRHKWMYKLMQGSLLTK